MTYFPDLSRREIARGGITYCNVGWLDRNHDFATGEVPQPFLDVLGEMLRFPAVRHRGWHHCEFCGPRAAAGAPPQAVADPCSDHRGDGVIEIPITWNFAYAAPSLIGHYVVHHGYRPPDEFINAAIAAWTASDKPRSFGPKCAWIAVRSSSPDAVAAALPLEGGTAAPWRTGVHLAYHGYVFVSPPIDGWVLAAGSRLPGPDEGRLGDRATPFIERLAAAFGDVQYFCTHRVVELHAWARATEGRMIRKFAYVGEAGAVLWNDGAPTEAEQALGLDFPPDFLDTELRPNEESVMQVAGLWSVDPSTLEDLDEAPSRGLVGQMAQHE